MVTQPLMNHNDPVQRALDVNIIGTSKAKLIQYQISKIFSDLVLGIRFTGIERTTPNEEVKCSNCIVFICVSNLIDIFTDINKSVDLLY